MNDFEFDLDKFDAEYQEEAPTEEVIEETVDETVEEETEVTDEEVAAEDEEVEEDEPSSEEEPETIHDPDAEKRNRAFADMRRQLEETKKYEAFMKQLAEQSGTSPEELMKRYEERKIEAEAKEKGVPVDVYKRLTELEQRDVQREQEVFSEKFNNEVNSVIEKESLSESDVENVFKYMAEEGFLSADGKPLIGFDKAYKLANLDTIVEKSKKEAVQDNLEKKRKRQQSSALPTGATTTQADNEIDEQVKADVKALLDLF